MKMAIDIKELAKNKPMKMSGAETKRVVNNYMKENRTLNTVIENLKKRASRCYYQEAL